tara:strand:+ start:2194 stop:2382 length:189 start_codon:yes stop_codon:yes gene_type:complete
MPGMTNRRRAIQEGTDWTNPKAKGYNFGGPVRVGTGKGRNTPVIEDAVASATQAKKKKLRKR